MLKKILTNVVVLVAVVGSIVLLLIHDDTIRDYIRLQFYDAPVHIVKLADESGMSDYGRRLFYVSTPKILPEAQFDSICDFEELGLVLGCYNGREIYILDVQEERLEPVESVTAAHEMLHVAYSRLKHDEQRALSLLFDEQMLSSSNDRISKEIEAYEDDPTADINNELHSIIGSEYGQLIPELEEYYSQYFDDRYLVVESSAKYEKVFTELEKVIEGYDKRLQDLKTSIDSLEAEVAALNQQITSTRALLEEHKNANRISEYNALVSPFNALVESHNSKIALIRQYIDEYNALVKERNENVIEQNDLIKSLDSDLRAI